MEKKIRDKEESMNAIGKKIHEMQSTMQSAAAEAARAIAAQAQA